MSLEYVKLFDINKVNNKNGFQITNLQINPDGHDSHVTFPGLVKIRGEHVWKSWAKV